MDLWLFPGSNWCGLFVVLFSMLSYSDVNFYFYLTVIFFKIIHQEHIQGISFLNFVFIIFTSHTMKMSILQ